MKYARAQRFGEKRTQLAADGRRDFRLGSARFGRLDVEVVLGAVLQRAGELDAELARERVDLPQAVRRSRASS